MALERPALEYGKYSGPQQQLQYEANLTELE